MIDVPVFDYRTKEQKKADVLAFKLQYERNQLSAREVADKAFVTIAYARTELHRAGVKKKVSKRGRVASFLWFYERRIYTIPQISKFTGHTIASVREFLSTSGARKMTISAAIDKLVSDGFSFERALSIINKSSDAYYASMLRQVKK